MGAGTLTDSEAAALGGVIAGLAGTVLLLSLFLWVLLVIARWKMFTKAGEAGWKSIIPIYSDYVLYRLVWNTQNFWIELGMSVGAALVGTLGGAYVVSNSGQLVATGTGNPILTAVSGLLWIAAIVWTVRNALKTARAYGKGAGFGIGLLLFPYIFSLILGFGSAEYVGPQE